MCTLFSYRIHCHKSRPKRPAVASGSHAVAGRRWLVAVTLCLLMLPSLQAQVEALWLSPDVTTRVLLADGSTVPIGDSTIVGITFPDGEAFNAGDVLAGDGFFNPVAVDGFDLSLLAFSIDIDAQVTPISSSSVFMSSGEIRATDGALLFDPVAAGLPANTDIDAVSVDPATGDLLFSVEQFIGDVPGPGFILPADIISWDGSSLGIFFNGLILPRSINVDAVHVLNDGDILMSFDTSGTITGVGGLRDEDLLVYDPVAGTFQLFAIIAASGNDWFPADVDALSAVEGATGFTIGGTVSGLAGNGLVLRNNGGDDLAISGNGGFTFATPVPDGDMYDVTVASQPSGPAQNCTVSNGSGTVSGANVTNVQVTCVTGGQVQFASSVAEVMENEGPVTLTVNRVGGSDGAASFTVFTTSVTATDGDDYTGIAETLSWTSGDSSDRTVTIPIINDGATEATAETFNVSLIWATGSALPGSPTTATVTIFDNETVQFADGFEGEP